MRVKPIPAFELAGEDTTGRSPGLHASDLYGGLYQVLDPKRYSKNAPMDWTRIALGLAWEQYLEQRMRILGLNASRPGELYSSNGFYYSPDLFEFNGKFRIGEIKYTDMSCRDWPKKPTNTLSPQFGKWQTQVMLYCSESCTPHVTIYPCFAHGDYRDNAPRFLPVEIEFTARELKENKQMLLAYGRNEGLLR